MLYSPDRLNVFTRSVVSLCDPMEYSLLGFSVPGISQGRTLEWVVIFFSRAFSPSRDHTVISCIGRWILNHWATRRVPD